MILSVRVLIGENHTTGYDLYKLDTGRGLVMYTLKRKENPMRSKFVDYCCISEKQKNKFYTALKQAAINCQPKRWTLRTQSVCWL